MQAQATTNREADLRYLRLLARQYPTVQAASSEIINLAVRRSEEHTSELQSH